MDVPALAKDAETIVVGKVKEKLVSGQDDNESRLAKVYTDVVLIPEKYLKNPQPVGEITVRLAGGIVDGMNVIVEDEAPLEAGERALLFLRKDKDGMWTVAGAVQGKYALANGRARNGPDERSLSEVELEKEIEQSISN